MPAQLVPASRSVTLGVLVGTGEDGNPVYHHITYGGLKPDASVQGVYDFAAALAGLQSYTLSSLTVVDRGDLFNA